MKRRRASLVAALAVPMLLVACERPATPSANAIVAKAGGETISEFELNRAVARLGPMSPQELEQARAKVLEALIDQHLVSRAAKDVKLETVPEVALALQQAQRQVLVEAYMARLFKDMPPPSESEIQDYYKHHPELFEQRKLYRVRELELQLSPQRMVDVEAQLKRSPNLSAFADWLKAQRIAFKSGEAAKPAEKIPDAMLAQLVTMKVGEAAVVPMDESHISVLQLRGIEAQPVSLEQASNAIGLMIQSGKRKTLLDAEIRRLRESGKVDYAKGFAPAPAGSSAPSGTP